MLVAQSGHIFVDMDVFMDSGEYSGMDLVMSLVVNSGDGLMANFGDYLWTINRPFFDNFFINFIVFFLIFFLSFFFAYGWGWRW